ncbi:D-cysteine desulfhydrase family protein [Microbacterium sp. P05]|uniref:D-cysteine desulfhydrase family protein n=1 Tax=Microbacterium sp. P05 TaxID=3366948 RepID=UPI00374517FD
MASRISLLSGATPIERAPRLAEALGIAADRFWIKRDDLIGLGGGGNKVRKLQYSLRRALDAHARALVTTGAPQSNHARLTAAAGARLGVDVVLVLTGAPAPITGNVLLDSLFGASIVWAEGEDAEARADDVTSQLERDGRQPFRIPFGGSDSHSAQGYTDAADEIIEQIGEFDQIVTAVGSGGTMAGLVSRLGPHSVVGVHCGAVDDPRSTVTGLLAGMPGAAVDPSSLRIDLDQVGEGYEHLTPAARQAMELFARTEGVVLDPTYTARAAAGLITGLADGTIGANERTVFLHSGGLPSVFAHEGVAGIRF